MTVVQDLRKATTRVSVDLCPSDYDILRDFAHVHRMKHVDVLRALVGLLEDDTVAGRVGGEGAGR